MSNQRSSSYRLCYNICHLCWHLCLGTYLSYDCEAGFYIQVNNWVRSSDHEYELSMCVLTNDGHNRCDTFLFQLPDIAIFSDQVLTNQNTVSMSLDQSQTSIHCRMWSRSWVWCCWTPRSTRTMMCWPSGYQWTMTLNCTTFRYNKTTLSLYSQPLMKPLLSRLYRV